jgi:hypothetical protein
MQSGQRDSEVALGVGQVRLELERLLEALHGLAQATLPCQGNPQIVVGVGEARPQIQGPPATGLGLVQLAQGLASGTEETERVRMVGVGFQDLPIDPFGLRQLAGLVMLAAKGYRFVNRWHWNFSHPTCEFPPSQIKLLLLA